MKIIVILAFLSSIWMPLAQADELQSETVNESRALVSATEKVSVSSEITAVSYTHLTLPTKRIV